MLKMIKKLVDDATYVSREGGKEMLDSMKFGGTVLKEGAEEIKDTLRFMFTGDDRPRR